MINSTRANDRLFRDHEQDRKDISKEVSRFPKIERYGAASKDPLEVRPF